MTVAFTIADWADVKADQLAGHFRSEYLHLGHVIADDRLRKRIAEALREVQAEQRERDVRTVLQQRCERDTPWDLTCMTIVAKLREDSPDTTKR